MAATSTVQYGRAKKNVYGKGSKSSWSTNFFDESDDELSKPTPPSIPPATRPVAPQNASVKNTYSVQKTEIKKAASPKATKKKEVKQDTFDVPSSDDDSSPPAKVVQQPLFRSRRLLVDDRKEAEAKLAPWEQEEGHYAASRSKGVASAGDASAAKPKDQLHSDLLDAARSVTQKRSATSQLDKAPSSMKASQSASEQLSKPASAAARLAARKRGAEPNLSSADELAKADNVRSAHEGTPRKRARTTSVSRGTSVDVAMIDSAASPRCDSLEREIKSRDGDPGIYDFPDLSADESAKPRQRSRSPKVTRKLARRKQLNGSSIRSPANNGVSAPARLAEMLPTDSDMTETSMGSPPVSMSRGGTPQQPSTPPSRKTSSPDTAIKSRGNITPKQAQLWNRLLPSEPVVPSPSALAMKDLTISSQKIRKMEHPLVNPLARSNMNAGRRRTRLVDRLKASAQSSSEDESGDSSSESEDVDTANGGENTAKKPPLLRAESSQSKLDTAPTSQSQTHSQLSVGASMGLKRTYASQRSHLAEDNLEDDIMAGLIEETSKQSAASRKPVGRSQSHTKRDAFDMDDSDDETAGTGAIRTIHELRAAGRNIRGTEDIEQLLEDIENHTSTHKSRRRSALIELVTKLADKNFASRLIGQGCDVRLARQCGTSQDDIASFILAAALALLLASDPPQHTLRMLQDSDIASWLEQQLSSTQEISKMAKERQHNLAKASQTSLIQLAELVQAQQSLWGEGCPVTMHTRIIALKALDLLIGKLRRAGDKNELLATDHLPLILPATDAASDLGLDTSLAVSILESLSTASLAVAWDADLIQRIGRTLTSLNIDTAPRRHTFFLTLRLTLNLTTDNARNCALLSTDRHPVHSLLETVLTGFRTLDTDAPNNDDDDELRALTLDLLVLALGILINLFEHSPEARTHATTSLPSSRDPLLPALVQIFATGQHRTLEAESVAESISNVALGYLAVALANLCQDLTAREVVRDGLPGRRIAVVGDAVEVFVLFHAQVDGMSGLHGGGGTGSGDAGVTAGEFEFEGEEGRTVWGGFTEKLRRVLERVRGLEEEGESMVVG